MKTMRQKSATYNMPVCIQIGLEDPGKIRSASIGGQGVRKKRNARIRRGCINALVV